MTGLSCPAKARYAMGLLASLAAVSLVGCSHSAPGAPAPGIAASASPAGPASSQPVAAPAGPAEPMTRAGARAAAVHFDRLYLAGQFAATWDLLAPAVKQQIPQDLWVKVHDSCLSGNTGKARIRAVTVFGDVAVVTETRPGTGAKHGRDSVVFSYTDRHWDYSPGDPGIYQHGSVAANVAAAKAAGFCTSGRAF
jgi:hypothetical protein